MSFLCIFFKQDVPDAVKNTAVDTQRLQQLLCPYRGEGTCHPLESGRLYLSSLAGRVNQPTVNEGATYTLPRNTHKNPQTAWLEIIADKEGVRFQTDPLGTFPLWCFEDDTRLVITGEVKSLMALTSKVEITLDTDALARPGKRPANFSPYTQIRRIQPGATLHVSATLVMSEQGGLPLVYQPETMFATEIEAKAALTAALVNSAQAIGNAEGGWGTFLSGGIDSSTATVLLQKQHPDLQTFTLGTEFGNEYADAGELATFLGTAHAEVFATTDEAIAHFERAIFCNETVDGLTAETLAQLSVLAQTATKHVSNIVTGYGADLLFGSMLRHELYMKVTGVDDLQSLIERTCWTGEFSPFFAWSLGIEIHHLFWDPQLMNCAFRIPANYSFDGIREKVALRTLAVENGFMQHCHAFRKKHAMTDGTQFNRVLSNAFALDSHFAYDKKGERCVAFLERLFGSHCQCPHIDGK